jgi:hypothetical protein
MVAAEREVAKLGQEDRFSRIRTVESGVRIIEPFGNPGLIGRMRVCFLINGL